MNLNNIFKRFKKSKDEIKSSFKLEQNRNSSNAEELIEQGISKAKIQNFYGAIEDFNKAIEIEPENSTSYLERSKVKRKLGDTKGADEDLKLAQLKIDALNLGLNAYDLADSNYDSENYLEAIENYTKAILYIPSLNDVYYNRGIAKEMLGDFDKAIEDFTKGIESNASNKVDSYFRRGYLRFYKFGDEVGALLDYNNAIKLNPTNSDFYYHRAKILDTNDALQDLNKAEQLGQSDTNLYYDIYVRKLEKVDYTGCIKALDKFIEIYPTSKGKVTLSKGYYLRGFMKTALNDHHAALLDYDKTIELDNKNAEAFYWRGVTKNTLGNNYSGMVDLLDAETLGFNIEKKEYNLTQDEQSELAELREQLFGVHGKYKDDNKS